jgi:uncharacterized protein (DUF58 family)
MLPTELYQQVRQIRIRTRRLVDGAFAGEYMSVFKGRGMEFAEVREYIPGDDVRTIDWNVTARMGQPFVKQYMEERELTVMLLIDVSASGRFGSVARLKTEIAAELSAVLALSALRHNDKVGLILFSDRIEKFLPPQKGKNRALRIIREILSFKPQSRGTDIALALNYLQKVLPGRTVSFLLSDFVTGGFEGPLRRARHNHDIVPVSISDRRDFELPSLGLIALQDLETGETVLIDTGNAALCRQYQERQLAAQGRQRQLFGSLGIEAIEVRTDESLLNPLIRFFRRRESGRR